VTVTVAVATRGRPAQLPLCLAAVRGGSVQPDELLVVDQAPSAEGRAAAERAQATYVEDAGRGVSRSRNRALAAASSEVLVVTDDDCIPDRLWLESLLAALGREPPPSAVAGSVRRPLGEPPPGAQAISLRESTEPADFRGRVLPWRAGSGANFAAPVALLRELGGWDERLGAGTAGRAGEDMELIDRILRSGGLVRYAPDAIIRHDWHTSARRLETRWTYGYGLGALAGLRAGQRDRHALLLFLGALRIHAMPLAVAVRRGDLRGVRERVYALTGTVAGTAYGLRAARRRG
jgi:GT2 family glycosyltransferase